MIATVVEDERAPLGQLLGSCDWIMLERVERWKSVDGGIAESLHVAAGRGGGLVGGSDSRGWC